MMFLLVIVGNKLMFQRNLVFQHNLLELFVSLILLLLSVFSGLLSDGYSCSF